MQSSERDVPPKDTNYANYPQSVQDIKSDKSGLSKDWNPRDVLIDILRDIDRGLIKPNALMVVYRNTLADGSQTTGFATSAPDRYITSGLFNFGHEAFMKNSCVVAAWVLAAEFFADRIITFI